VSGDSGSALATTWEAKHVMGLTSGALLKHSVGASLDGQARQFTRAWKHRSTDVED
jgi:hypothetical protein